MSLVVTDAIVLHAFDYLESSRILRLVTRDAGVRSALARGARRSKKRFGSAVDLFAQGTAELHVKAGRDLDTLAAFDVARARPGLGEDLSRFAGASAIAELTLRFAREAADPGLFDAVATVLDELATAPAARACEVTLAGAWRVLAEMGVGPVLDECIECHTVIPPDAPALFSHPAGGVLCARCGHLSRSGRSLPPDARAALRDWLGGVAHTLSGEAEERAHQRLLREFLHEHLGDSRELRAFSAWENQRWGRAS